MTESTILHLAEDLELAGLLWQPEIGDEIADRARKDNVSILVDPFGMSPEQLRSVFIWLPTVEQMVLQFEARQAILFHTGLELSENAMQYKTVIQCAGGKFEVQGPSLRTSVGLALRTLLLGQQVESLH